VTDRAAMVHEAILQSLGALCAAVPEARFARRPGYTFLSYPAIPLPVFNGVWSGDDDIAAARALEDELESVRQSGVAPGVWVLDGHAPRLLEEARRLGLTDTETAPGMMVTPGSFRPAAIDDAIVERAETQEALDEACEVMCAGFGMPCEWFRPMYRRDVLDACRGEVYVVRAARRAVSTALCIHGGDSAGIFNVGTAEADRKRGYGAMVSSRAVESAMTAGARFAYLQSSAMAESIYRRLGFENVSSYTIAFGPA